MCSVKMRPNINFSNIQNVMCETMNIIPPCSNIMQHSVGMAFFSNANMFELKVRWGFILANPVPKNKQNKN